jgi:diacylglycerol diphosphate phosphatase / phosphatidate phosphatase
MPRSVYALGTFGYLSPWNHLLIQRSDIYQILDGRKSFPSGHSSTAFVGMTFITLFLAGKTAALCFSVTPSGGALLRSRFARLCLVLLPLVYAAWVAITRVEDYVGRSSDCFLAPD